MSISAIDDIEYRTCPLCDASDFDMIWKEWGNLGIVQCKICGMIYTNPYFQNSQSKYLGNKEAYLKEAELIFRKKARSHRDKNYIFDLAVIHKFKPKGRMLDIGTNMGMFLRNAKNKNWDLYGIEPSPPLAEIAREKFGLNIFQGYLKDANFSKESFDIVTMVDVFEHIYNPNQLLKNIHRVLRNDGIVFINVPNVKFSLLKLKIFNKVLKRLSHPDDIFRDIFDSREHLIHYSQKTLRKILEKNYFVIEKFYVGKPINTPLWRSIVGEYYQYEMPIILDWKFRFIRQSLYIFALIVYFFTLGKIGCFASHIIAVARKNEKRD